MFVKTGLAKVKGSPDKPDHKQLESMLNIYYKGLVHGSSKSKFHFNSTKGTNK